MVVVFSGQVNNYFVPTYFVVVVGGGGSVVVFLTRLNFFLQERNKKMEIFGRSC